MTSMMRVSGRTNSNVKLLKEFTGSKDSNGAVVDKLVEDALLNFCADTNNGFIRVGSVVRGRDGFIGVISEVTKDKVTFRCGGHVVNGSAFCKSLEVISDSAEEYEGGVSYA